MIRILIIEDDSTIRENTAELLELEGYDPMTASNGKIGLEIINHHPPDVILCDLRMSEMDGFAVLGYLGKHPDLKRIPFIFFTFKSEKSDIKIGMDSGADGYLTKPFDLPDLLNAIEKCLYKKKSLLDHLTSQ